MKDTRFQIGNEFWKLAPNSGRKPIYSTPEELEQDCYDYIEATIQRNNWDKQHWVGKDGEEVTIRQPIPFTKSGLYVFLGIVPSTWDNYKQKPEFLEIITRIEQIIITQKMEGAITGHFNPNIIARDLGLADKKDLDIRKVGADAEDEEYVD